MKLFAWFYFDFFGHKLKKEFVSMRNGEASGNLKSLSNSFKDILAKILDQDFNSLGYGQLAIDDQQNIQEIYYP